MKVYTKILLRKMGNQSSLSFVLQHVKTLMLNISTPLGMHISLLCLHEFNITAQVPCMSIQLYHQWFSSLNVCYRFESTAGPDLFLLSRTTLQSFSQPPLSFNMPVWTICPTGTSKSLAHRCCSSSKAWSPEDWDIRAEQKVQAEITLDTFSLVHSFQKR